MYPEILFDYVLEQLADEIATASIPKPNPLPCDRWVARSALQKTIRRNDLEIAHRSLATLLRDHPSSIWRTLTIIALEDVGAADIDVVARVVAAGRNRSWRAKVGGEWTVAAVLVKQMAETLHCQAACDLLLRCLHDPAYEVMRVDGLEIEEKRVWVEQLRSDSDLHRWGVAALALGGGLADEQRFRDPGAVFAAASAPSHVVEVCLAAWRLSRNPMAMLLPRIWKERHRATDKRIVEDEFGPTELIDGVPSYALDQFTRSGRRAIRLFLDLSPRLRDTVRAEGAATAAAAIVGDLIFLREGGLLAQRAVWRIGDDLRLPHRLLGSIAGLEPGLLDNLLGELSIDLLNEARWAFISHPPG